MHGDAYWFVRSLAHRNEALVTRSAREQRANVLEKRCLELTRSLEDSTLYDTPDGVSKAQKLGQQLDTARESLDEAMHEWGVAAEQKQTIGKG